MARKAPLISIKSIGEVDPRAWAARLRAKEFARPGSLLRCQQNAWREALQESHVAPQETEADREARIEREGIERY
jgi:hypothetical protein